MEKKLLKLLGTATVMMVPMMVNAATTFTVKCDAEKLNPGESMQCKLNANTTDKISSLDVTLKTNSENLKLYDYTANSTLWQGDCSDGRCGLYTSEEYTGELEIATFKVTADSEIKKNVNGEIALDETKNYEVYLSDNLTKSEVSQNAAKVTVAKNVSGFNVWYIVAGVVALAAVAIFAAAGKKKN